VNVAVLLDTCRARGIELTASGQRLWLRGPACAVDDALRNELRTHKAELIAKLTSNCPGCRRPTDEKGRCWHCHDRQCETCGKPTGSAFISRCICCDLTSTRC
jgi:hypothetical protein